MHEDPTSRAGEGLAPSQNPAPKLPPLFDSLCVQGLEESIAVCKERGGQYGDTWRTCQFLTMRAIYRKFTGKDLPRDLAMVMHSGAMMDMKLERMLGAWKDDSAVDLCNYSAFTAEAVKRLEEAWD